MRGNLLKIQNQVIDSFIYLIFMFIFFRVTFMVSSKKASIILEISLILKIFNEIGPEDINVTCVLGDVR